MYSSSSYQKQTQPSFKSTFKLNPLILILCLQTFQCPFSSTITLDPSRAIRPWVGNDHQTGSYEEHSKPRLLHICMHPSTRLQVRHETGHDVLSYLDCLVTKIHKAFIFIILISSFGSDLPLKGVLRSRGQILSAKAFTLGIWSQAEDQIPCSRSNAKLLSDITIMIKLPVMNNFFKRAKKSFHHLTYIMDVRKKKQKTKKTCCVIQLE